MHLCSFDKKIINKGRDEDMKESIKDEYGTYVKSMELSLRTIRYKRNRPRPLKDVIHNRFALLKNQDINLISKGKHFILNLYVDVKSRLIEIRRIVITPSRIELELPTNSIPNRTLNMFRDHKDDFTFF